MTKTTPPLSIVGSSSTTGIEPPRSLGQPGRQLWDTVQDEYRVTDSGGAAMLLEACAELDRAEELAAAIKRDGAVIYSKSGPKPNPCLKEELAARAFVVRTLQKLGITSEPVKSIGRPGVGFGWKGG